MNCTQQQQSPRQEQQSATFDEIHAGGDIGLRAKFFYGTCSREESEEPGNDETVIINADESTTRRAAAERLRNAQWDPLKEEEVRSFQTSLEIREDGFTASFSFEPKDSKLTNHRGETLQAEVEIGSEEPQLQG